MKCFVLTVFICVLALANYSFGQAPSNDECTGATVIPSLPDSFYQNTRLATPNVTDPPLICADGGGGNSVWYEFTPDSSGWVTFTTRNSTPADYDVAMGIFTGTCGSLTMVACNDDINPGSNRQAEIILQVVSGTTYIIYIGEWNGGGPSGGIPTGGDLRFKAFWSGPPPPIVTGPKSGSVPNGFVITTGAMALFSVGTPPVKDEIENEPDVPLLPAPPDVIRPKGPPGSNYIEANAMAPSSTLPPLVLDNFKGYDGTGFYPPDPIMAVGPNHIIIMVNSSFKIFDKSGNQLKNISLGTWFASTGVNPGFSDPQVLYDHYAHRWIMAGGDFSPPYNILLSVSDDDNPLGTWYNWALPATLGDSVTGNFPDYPQMGYDENAIYITTREFGSSRLYTRLRIIPKAQLYTNTAGPVVWTDFWDFRDPQYRLVAPDGLCPSIIYGAPGVHFLVNASPYYPGTYITVWTIKNPITTPVITAEDVPVVEYSSAGNPSQLGAGNPIEGGGSAIRHKAIYRDSSLYIVHSIASGTNNTYSAVHFVRINPFTNNNLEDVAMGLNGYWHYYPSVMVDPAHDVVITYSRSGTTEYAGAYVAGRPGSASGVLSQSTLLKPGVAHYEAFPSPQRNRWGDYLGIGLDPVDSNSFWMHGMYTSSTDAWGTWVGQVKMPPVPGRYIFAAPSALDFGIREIGTTGDTLYSSIANYGVDTLTISEITLTDTNFTLFNPPILPIRLATNEKLDLSVVFNPKITGKLSGSILVTNDNVGRTPAVVSFKGECFSIALAQTGTIYATTNNGNFLKINPLSGSASIVGPSGYNSVPYARVNPNNHTIFALIPAGANTFIARINSEGGDAHPVSTISKQWLKGLAVRGDTLYTGWPSGALFRLNTQTGDATQIASTGLNIAGLAFNPISGDLWATGRIGSIVDRVYKINLPSGTTTVVGSTGLGTQVNDIAFDGNGNLFGVISANAPSNLVLIDTLTGAATIIGTIGFNGVSALAMDPLSIISTFTYRWPAQWNLFSIPLSAIPKRKNVVFPTAASEAFSYVGSYTICDTLFSGSGYWMKFDAPTVTTFSGALNTRDTIDVRMRWNMIGSISFPVVSSTIVSIPPDIRTSPFYTYVGGGYNIADSIKPGTGYWVRVSSDGQLVMASGPAALPKTAAASERELLNNLNTLLIQDARGNMQTLYFGKQPNQEFQASRFEIPPVPPDDALNARFTSNCILEVHPDKLQGSLDFPLVISSQAMPIRITWRIVDNSGTAYSFVYGKNNSSKASLYILRGDGSIMMGSEELANLRLRVNGNLVPTEFALQQNYPNPFNPTTKLVYQLPENSKVTLRVYNTLGQIVATLTDKVEEAGFKSVEWNANDVASGIYYYRLDATSTENPEKTFSQVKQMVLLK